MIYLGGILSVSLLPANTFTGEFSLANIQNFDFQKIENIVFEGSSFKSDAKNDDAGVYLENELVVSVAGFSRLSDFTDRLGKYYTCLFLDSNDDYYLVAPISGLIFIIQNHSIPNKVTSRPGLTISLTGSDLQGAIKLR